MRLARFFLVVLALGMPLAAAAQPSIDPNALEKQATDLFAAGKTVDAIGAFERLRAARRAAGDPTLEARALWRLALAYRAAGRSADAIRSAKDAFQLARQAASDMIAAEALGQLHQLNTYLPEFPDAPRALDEMLRLARSAAQPRTLARTFDLRARWFGDRGQLDEARVAVDDGLGYAAAADDQAQLAGLYAIRSVYESRSGRLGDALADALRARDAAAKVGPRAEVTALYSLAQVHAHLSNAEESVRLWTDVIDRYRAIGPAIGVPIALDARCHIAYELERYDMVLSDCKASIDGFLALKQPPSSASYSRAGMASIRLGRDTEARKWLAEAEARLEGAPGFEQAQTLTQLGMARVMLGEVEPARDVYNRMLAIGRSRGSLEDEWKAQLGLGRAALIAHDPGTAINHLERAATLIERLRTTVPAQELRAAYLARRVEAHEWLAAALMMQSASPSDRHVEAAFNVAERARVRALSDLMAEGRARRGARAIAPPAARTRQEIAANLAPGELLIEYLVGEQHAYAWALTRDQLVGFRLPSPADIDADVRQALSYIEQDDREGLQRIGARLTPALLGPALARLSDLHRIIFVPDGALQRLPFAALPVPGPNHTYLAQHVAASSVGSGSLLGMLNANESAASRVLALSSGGGTASSVEPLSRGMAAPLRETAGEAADAIRMLGSVADSSALDNATELAVKRGGFADYRVIHVAAHSLIDEAFPRNSAILLRPEGGEDGALRSAEIAQIPVHADLVVLAACRTQLGRVLRGEGLLSLARSFMEAGARSVVASLWDVGDRDTRVLMRSFYAGIAAGLAPDEALRVSQLQMIRAGGALAAPKAWASFQVAGEGRRPVWNPRPTSAAAMAVAVMVMIAAAALLLRR